MTKKVLAVLAAVALATTLAACGAAEYDDDDRGGYSRDCGDDD